MYRRGFVFSSIWAGLAGLGTFSHRLGGLARAGLGRATLAAQGAGLKPGSESAEELFPAETLSELEWSRFPASGFGKPACGMIHRKDRPAEDGMPLGGVGTGCLDLDTDGTFGFCSIFGSFVPRRGKLRAPFLGLAMGSRFWVLATRYTEGIDQVETPNEIHYWGHYPVADLEYETTAPVSVGLRAWAPFVPGDIAISNTPGAVFEIRLRNLSRSRQQGKLIFTFPGPTQAEAQVSPDSPRENIYYDWLPVWAPVARGAVPARRQLLQGELNGVSVTSDQGVGYTLAVLGGPQISVGPHLDSVGLSWRWLSKTPPAPLENDFGSSLFVPFELDGREAKTLRIVLAWYAPLFRGFGQNCFTHMYAMRYPNSLAVAQMLARDHEKLLRRILNWQEAIYACGKLPVWLRETLVNYLHLITEDSVWAAAKPPIGEWCRPGDGLFATFESPRDSPQLECIPVSFFGNMPIVYFFPDLALSTLRGYKAYQFPDGAAPWIFGGMTHHPLTAACDVASPIRGNQTTLNGLCYAAMVDRYWLRTGSDDVLREFYESVKKNAVYTMNLNPGPDGVISMPEGNIDPATGERATEWVEAEPWYGMTPHVGGLHLAQLRIVERMAEKVGDKEFAERCRKWFKSGSDSLENKTWLGEYYLAYWDPENTGKRSDRIFSCQLDGDWVARFHGLPPVFRPDRAKATLATIKRTVLQLSPYGPVFLCNRDGTPVDDNDFYGAGVVPYAAFPPEQLMLAMTYMYTGEVDFGLEQARRCLHILMSRGYTWSQPGVTNAGVRFFGFDYYFNLMLWSLPAAVEGGNLLGPCAPGGLVDQVIQAGKKT